MDAMRKQLAKPSRTNAWSRRRLLEVIAAAGVLATVAPARAAAERRVRVGVLKFGTATWELGLVKQQALDRAQNIAIEVVEFAAKDAAAIALQAKAVDVILTDWIWVAARRKAGADFAFSAHSSNVGALMVGAKSSIKQLADLQDKRIGIAGGPVDKNWLLLRAYGQHLFEVDFAWMAQPVFAAPPLLNELAKRGEVDAALNFWPYGARLKAAGFRELVRVADILPALGITGQPPLLGWVFSEAWARQNRDLVSGFLQTMAKARATLAEDANAFAGIRPFTRAEDDAVFAALRESYVEGATVAEPAESETAAADLLRAIAGFGGLELEPLAEGLPAGTFWRAASGNI